MSSRSKSNSVCIKLRNIHPVRGPWKIYGLRISLKIMLHHKIIENLFWKLLKSYQDSLETRNVLCVLFTASWVKSASSVNTIRKQSSRRASIYLHNCNLMSKPCSSRCWMGWMWYRYKPSKVNACQTDMQGTPSCEQTLLVLWYRICSTMATVFS
jgi:hypothetical protein